MPLRFVLPRLAAEAGKKTTAVESLAS